MRWQTIICSILAMFLLTVGAAAAQTLPPGQYIKEGGSGMLDIKGAAAPQPFSLQTVGANAHTCSLEGTIRNGKAIVKSGGADTVGKSCVVEFRRKGEDLDITTQTPDSCREFCGMRAWFEGLFVKPTPACQPATQRKTRNDFKRLYDRKNYKDAQATLEPLLKQCSRILDRVEDGWIRNDLALTQYKLGDRAACLKTLQPPAELLAEVDQGVVVLAPAEEPVYGRMLKATRTNLKLCRGSSK